MEDKWPGIVERLHRRENVNDSLEEIFQFMALQRARVPASRDVTERIHAEGVMAAARRLDAEGKLSPKPEGLEDILDHVEVSINPHQSIHAMVTVMQATGQVFDQIGFYATHNKTDVPFLTSDNPVIWFDPSVRRLICGHMFFSLRDRLFCSFRLVRHSLSMGTRHGGTGLCQRGWE